MGFFVAGSFSKAVGKWARATPRRLDAIYARSVELLGEEMQRTRPEGGNLPFQTGNLANSLLASTESMPPTSDGPFTGGNIGLVAATLKATQFVFIGYQAKYSRRVNSGFVGADSRGRVYNQSGAHFVEKAVAEWPNIVRKAVTQVKAGK